MHFPCHHVAAVVAGADSVDGGLFIGCFFRFAISDSFLVGLVDRLVAEQAGRVVLSPIKALIESILEMVGPDQADGPAVGSEGYDIAVGVQATGVSSA